MYKYRLDNKWAIWKGRGKRTIVDDAIRTSNRSSYPPSAEERNRDTQPAASGNRVDLPIRPNCSREPSCFSRDVPGTTFDGMSTQNDNATGVDLSPFVDPPQRNSSRVSSLSTDGRCCSSDSSTLASENTSDCVSLLTAASFIRQVDPELHSVDRITHAIRQVTLATLNSSEVEQYYDIDEHFPFWHETGRSIYMRKISSLAQSFELLQSACNTAIRDPYQFVTNPLRSIYEMLTTVSSANTSIEPRLRGDILGLLVNFFAIMLPANHALTTVASHLYEHLGRSEVSDTAWVCMLQELDTVLKPTDPICFRARVANVRLLRRKGDHEGAYDAGRQLLKFARTHFGVHSDNARRAAREFENLLIELGQWAEALTICFSVVGQEIEDVGKVEPGYRDKCAIYVMQDIAKCYQNLCQGEKTMKWLEQAWSASLREWGEDASVTQHIREKFVTVSQGSLVKW
jgi:hypothetical protein